MSEQENQKSVKNQALGFGQTLFLGVVIVVAINYLVGNLGFMNARLDLTDKKIFTLSEGSKKVLSKINADKPVMLRYYETSDDRIMPPVLKNYARTIQDLLMMVQKESGGKVILQKISPNPNTEEEDRAKEDDIDGKTVNNDGDNIYLGLAIQSASKRESIGFFSPSEETSLEYNVVRAIAKVTAEKSNVIGVLSPLPIMGQPMMPFVQQQRQQDPWLLIQKLRQDYEVREIPVGTDKIDDDITSLLVLHPGDLEERTEFAIDQFVLRGGKLLACVDPHSVIAQAMSQGSASGPMGNNQVMYNTFSTLSKLFPAWGIGFMKDKILIDTSYMGQLRGRNTPVALDIPSRGINTDDRVTADLQNFMLVSSGAFTIDKKEGIEVKTLIESSTNSEFVDSTTADKVMNSGRLERHIPSQKKHALAVVLTGKFKTAFPNGNPTQKGSETEKKEGDKEVKEAPSADSSLKESKDDQGVVYLVADFDFIYDAFCVQRDGLSGNLMAVNSNFPLVMNIVELFAGGGDLMKVRSRASAKRPFETLKLLQEGVQARYRPQLEEQENRLQEIATKISTLSVKQDKKTKQFIIDPSQMKQLEELQKTQLDLNRSVRQIRKEQTKEVDFVRNILTAVNMLVVPLLIIAVGIFLAMKRRQQTAAV
jgi:ABC-type uncharacterized transport system involved in gliding motility auxiliary subunit